jgi:hypothetical protein
MTSCRVPFAGGRSVMAKGTRPLVMSLSSSVIPGNAIVLSAAAGNQVSSTYAEKGHGLFTYFLLKEIKKGVMENKGRLEIGTLYQSIKPQVERIARKDYNNVQTPQVNGSNELLNLPLLPIRPDR